MPKKPNKNAPTPQDLKDEIEKVKLQIEAERQERNFYQLERDKVNTHWEIAKNDLEEAQARSRNKDREREELHENHEVQIKVYKQKVKHLLHEHQNKLSTLKHEAEARLTQKYKENMVTVAELEKMKRELKKQRKEIVNNNRMHIKTIQENHHKETTKLRQDFERRAEEMHEMYVQKARDLRENVDAKAKAEWVELQQQKDAFIDRLMEKNKAQFDDIKSYYYDITQNNMNLIVSLKEKVEELKKQAAQDMKKMFEMQTALSQALEPLERSEEKVKALTQELQAFDATKDLLKQSSADLKVRELQLKDAKWEHEVLEQRFAQVQKERDDLYDQFVRAIHDVGQKTGFKNLLLEKKLAALDEELEKKDAQLSEVLAASNLEPRALSAVSNKLEEVLNGKNQRIRELQEELERVSRAHNAAIDEYEGVLTKYNIPVEELGFRPVLTATAADDDGGGGGDSEEEG